MSNLFRGKLTPEQLEQFGRAIELNSVKADTSQNGTTKVQGEKAAFTIEVLDQFLSDNNISVSYDVISHSLEISGISERYDPEKAAAQLSTILCLI